MYSPSLGIGDFFLCLCTIFNSRFLLRQRLLSAVYALYGRLLMALLCGFTRPFCRGFVVLSKVFVFRYYRVVCPYHWRGGSSWNLHSSRT